MKKLTNNEKQLTKELFNDMSDASPLEVSLISSVIEKKATRREAARVRVENFNRIITGSAFTKSEMDRHLDLEGY